MVFKKGCMVWNKGLKGVLVAPNRKFNLSKEQLEDLYCNQKLTTKAISTKLGFGNTTIKRWLKRYDIPRRDARDKMYYTQERINKSSKVWFKKGTHNPKVEFKKGHLALWLKGKHLSEETKGKIGNANRGRKHTEDSKKKMSEVSIRCWQNPEYREHHTNIMKEKWQDTTYKEEMIKRTMLALNNKILTTPEKYLKELLNRHFHNEFWFNGNCELGVVLGGCVPDFVNVNGKKQVIEVFGDYWHNRPNIKSQQTEEGRRYIYSKLGWKCLILWEHELVNTKYGSQLSEDEIVNRINSFNEIKVM